MVKISTRDFLASVEHFGPNHFICPRCGGYVDVFYVSSMSGVALCDHCFLDECPPERENYDNWAVVTAVRAVCDTDIKIVKECVSKCCLL